MAAPHWTTAAQGDSSLFRLAVVGEGTDFELLPYAFNAGLKSIPVDCEVRAFRVPVEEFPDAVAHISASGYRAISVGNPLKPEAAKIAKEFYVVRHGLGVANALRLGLDVYAQNTEVPAFTSKIAQFEPSTALVMGSGRAARSAVMSLFECNWKVRIWNRNVIRSKPFVTLFERYGKVEQVSSPDPTGCSMIVNATPLGVKIGEQPPVQWAKARPKTIAIDFVYRQVATEFLRSASSRGFRTIDGRELLIEQAALAIEWWTNKHAPREPMLQAISFRKPM